MKTFKQHINESFDPEAIKICSIIPRNKSKVILNEKV